MRGKPGPFDVNSIDHRVAPVQSTITIADGQMMTLSRFQLPSDSSFFVTNVQVIDINSNSAPPGLEVQLYNHNTGTVVQSWSSSSVSSDDPLYATNQGDEISIRLSNGSGSEVTTSATVAGRITGQVLSSETGPDKGVKVFMLGRSSKSVHGYNVSPAYDVSTGSLVNSFDVSTQAEFPKGLTWNPSGTKFYIVSDGDNTHEYTVSTPYDISTATHNQVNTTLSGRVEGMAWNDDGTKIYTLDRTSGQVNAHSVNTAFDISSVSFIQNFSVSYTPRGMSFNDDGTKMYLVDVNNSNIEEFSLSAPFDISSPTSNHVLDLSSEDGSLNGMAWNGDGTKMYVVGQDNSSIFEYDVSIGFDISSTVSLVDSLNVGSEGSLPTAVTWDTTPYY